MEENMIVSVSPHIFSKRTTKNIMLDVIIALIPAAIAYVVVSLITQKKDVTAE